MKKIFTIVLVIFCTTSIMACKTKAKIEDNKETTDTIIDESTSEISEIDEDTLNYQDTVAWSVNESWIPDDNPDAVVAFNRSVEGMQDYHYEVVAVLSSQLEAGMNYQYLAKGEATTPDAKPEYVIVKLHEDLGTEVEITWSENLLGGDLGWEYNDSSLDIKDNPNVEAAFNKAKESLTEVNYEPIAYIGKKDNSYAILTKITINQSEPSSSIGLVFITSDDSGVVIDDIRGY